MPEISCRNRYPSTPSRSPSLDPEEAAIRAKRAKQLLQLQNDEESFCGLIKMGGRPAFPSLDIFYSPVGTRGEYEDIIHYWGYYWGTKGILFGQVQTWVLFREFQLENRKTAEIFSQYQQNVHDYRRNENIEDNTCLLFNHEQQTKVDEWKEYHYFQHRKLALMKEKTEKGRQFREKWEAFYGSLRPGHSPHIDEGEPGRLMILLNWIEQQLPEIARECAMSNKEASKDMPSLDPVKASEAASRPEETTPKGSNARSNRSSINRNKKSTTPALGPVQSLRDTSKTSRKSKSSVRRQQHNLHDSQLSAVRDADLQAQQPTPTVTPRRSPRLAMLQQKEPYPRSKSGVLDLA
jgi:hypothetical protein